MGINILKPPIEARAEFMQKLSRILEAEFSPDDLLREEFTEAFLLVMQSICGPSEIARVIRRTQVMQTIAPVRPEIKADNLVRIDAGMYVLASDVVRVGRVGADFSRIEVVTTQGRYLLGCENGESQEHALQRFVDSVNCHLKAR
ncbi:TPA: hypothetical protein ACMX4R_000030 [Yersinia enterocolitica]|nr:hypothetical protein EOL10_15000 [Citrobacter freundii]HBU6550724.1 hypothetical protein [Citrobacter freundii]HBV8463276.1 hypothetical protein [Citrobacter freundii]